VAVGFVVGGVEGAGVPALAVGVGEGVSDSSGAGDGLGSTVSAG
jgi:hypothetical protein